MDLRNYFLKFSWDINPRYYQQENISDIYLLHLRLLKLALYHKTNKAAELKIASGLNLQQLSVLHRRKNLNEKNILRFIIMPVMGRGFAYSGRKHRALPAKVLAGSYLSTSLSYTGLGVSAGIKS